MKKIINNRFMWYCIVAILGTILSCCYILKGETLLSICWTLVSVCNIVEAYITKEGDNNGDDISKSS